MFNYLYLRSSWVVPKMNMRRKGLYLSTERLAKLQRITMVKIVKNTF